MRKLSVCFFLLVMATRAAGPDAKRREDATERRPPTILRGCGDFQMPPERVYGGARGDWFIVHLAGEALSEETMASIESSVNHREVSTVLVLGEEQCAGLEETSGYLPKGVLRAWRDKIRPAVWGVVLRLQKGAAEASAR
jgi:carbonic anhydrase